jgi:hypothetical protein
VLSLTQTLRYYYLPAALRLVAQMPPMQHVEMILPQQRMYACFSPCIFETPEALEHPLSTSCHRLFTWSPFKLYERQEFSFRFHIGKKAQTWSNMGEKARWTTLDGHGQEIRKMEAKGHITGSCSSVYDNVHVQSKMSCRIC